MRSNLELYQYSLLNPEPLIDDFYIKERDLIISTSPDQPNDLMTANMGILENVTAFKVAKEQNNLDMQRRTLSKIQRLLQNPELNYSEFASFWAVVDVSYSLYTSLSPDQQLVFLDSVIQKYIEMRHRTYLSHGYSATTLQVGKDAKAHKSSGSLGGIKAASILSEFGYSPLADLSLNSFNDSDNIFLFTDKTGKTLFREILSEFRINFLWSSRRQNKMPDVLVKKGGHLFIIEQKHVKENGGGQDKQVSEVIDFVGFSEEIMNPIVHYVTFLDGLYFNLLASPEARWGKLLSQTQNIQLNLTENPQNYFVNTAGFRELLTQIRD